KVATPYPDEMRDPPPGIALGSSESIRTAVPRASVYRKSAHTLLVASEGTESLLELDGRSLAPALQPLRDYERISSCVDRDGIALSLDESVAFVHCAGSFTVATVVLKAAVQQEPITGGYEQETYTATTTT